MSRVENNRGSIYQRLDDSQLDALCKLKRKPEGSRLELDRSWQEQVDGTPPSDDVISVVEDMYRLAWGMKIVHRLPYGEFRILDKKTKEAQIVAIDALAAWQSVWGK